MDLLTAVLTHLVAIDSVNPDLVPGAAGEREIADFIARWLRDAGVEVELDESVPGRPNVIGIARGTGGGKTLLLNGHVDTVGVVGMNKPHMPYVENGRMYGRGAYDMKCGVAACMVAIAEARKLSLRGDVVFTAVVDEEYAGLGTMGVAALESIARADGAIIAEPTHLELITAHKGFVWYDIETHGVAAHGSMPALGVDAIAKMGLVLTGIAELNGELLMRPPHPLLGTGSIHASLIQGGQELSSYPERCVVSVERRTVPGESPESAERELQTLLDEIGLRDPAFRASIRRGLGRTPMETPLDSEIVGTVAKAAEKVLGSKPSVAGVPYWTDAATLSAAGIPTVLFGPMGGGAHATQEWVELASVEACSRIYLQAAVEFCK
jgi:acetylornithine deacetylase